VFDAVVFVQAMINSRGPSAACIERVSAGEAILFLSNAILAEIRDVPLRPELTRRYTHLTLRLVESFVEQIQAIAMHVAIPSKAFTLRRDPDDQPYIDLAIAANAQYLVTWNERHLTYLMRGDTPEGKEFREKFPAITILSPPDFLRNVLDQ
jgi:putative PIN family toxin of toxin-antitoxin system